MTVTMSGPLFDGSLERRMDRGIEQGVRDAGDAARRNVQRADSQTFYSSTGYTSSRVTVEAAGPMGFRVTGGGLVWRPWLEGIAPRNRKSRFKGHRPFEKARRPTEESSRVIIRDAIMKALR